MKAKQHALSKWDLVTMETTKENCIHTPFLELMHDFLLEEELSQTHHLTCQNLHYMYTYASSTKF